MIQKLLMSGTKNATVQKDRQKLLMNGTKECYSLKRTNITPGEYYVPKVGYRAQRGKQ